MDLEMSKKKKRKVEMDLEILMLRKKAKKARLDRLISEQRKAEMDLEMSKKKKAEMDLELSKDLEISKKKEKEKDRVDLTTSTTKEKQMIDWILTKRKDKKIELQVKKEAVLIGLKHPDPQMMNNNGIDIKEQISRMKDHLVERRGFPEDNITLMMPDEDKAIYVPPTDENIRFKLCSLVESSKRGDILFIHLIAYGCVEGCILAADKIHIPDSFFRVIIWKAAKKGCHLTFVSDCIIGPAGVCGCPRPTPPQSPRPTREELEKESREFWDEQYARPDDTFLDGFATIDFRTYIPTDLYSVDICNPTKKISHHQDASSRVILLTPFRRLDQNTTTLEEEDHSLDDHDHDHSLDDHDHDHSSDQNTTTSLDDENAITEEEEDDGLEEDVFADFIIPEHEPKKDSRIVNVSESELFFPPPKGTTTTHHTLYGGFTKTILDVIDESTDGNVTNLELAQKTMEKLGTIPGLSCSRRHHAYASFILCADRSY